MKKLNLGKFQEGWRRMMLITLTIFFIPIASFSKDNSLTEVKLNTNLAEKNLVLQKYIEITGVVKDEFGIPLEGVTILVNRRGTTTNKNGRYRARAKRGDKITFSYIGFKTQTVIVKDKKVINITMQEDNDQLDEVVLIGYGKQERRNVSSAISSIKGATVQENLQSGATFERGIEGLVKGVLVTQGTGQLGAAPDIIIRGITSPFLETENVANNNNPLYVIDGVQITTGGKTFNPLEAINPADVESIDVLKDAAATSIYGSRGANGVIIVKTKTGNYNQPTTVNISMNTTIGSPVKTLDYLDAKGFKEYILALNKNSYDYYNGDGKDYEYGEELANLQQFGFRENGEDRFGYTIYDYDPKRVKFYNGNTDWNKVVYRSAAVTSQLNTSVTGGGEKSSYGFSFSYTDQEGLLKADERKKYNARLNYQFNLGEKLKIGTSVNYSNSNISTGYSNRSQTDFSNTILGSEQLRFRPDLPVYDANGDFTFDNIGTESNPVLKPNPVAFTTLGAQKSQKNNTIIASVFGEYDITSDLMFKAEYSLLKGFDDVFDFKPKEYNMSGYLKGETVSKLVEEKVELTNRNASFTLNYTKNINGNHLITGLLGFTHNEDEYLNSFIKHTGFVDGTSEPQFSSNIEIKERNLSISGLNSYISRLTYTYKDRYGIAGTARLDRSSRFAPQNRNAFFPSVSAHWNIHNESFISKDLFRELKLRASYGNTGSVSVGDFSYLQTFDARGTSNYNGGSSIAFGQKFANKNLKWEKTREYNIGLDFRLKKNILRGGVDFYNKKSTDIISNDTELVETGADEFARNNATILNKGFELSLGSDIIRKQNFVWSVDLNASRNINKVLKLSNEIKGDNYLSRYYVVGREVNIIKGYLVNGIIQTRERIDKLNFAAEDKGHGFYDKAGTGAGDYEYKDVNGDGTINSKDLVILGSRQPDLFGGFSSKVRYKGITLGAYFSYSYGAETLRRNENDNSGRFMNVEKQFAAKYRWSPTNKTAKLPRLIHRSENPNNRPSNLNIYDASYIRLTSFKLGYNLPEDLTSRLSLNRINIYVSATNLVTWTSFPGIDPQGIIEGSRSTISTENFDAYPLSRTYSLGVNMNF